MLMTMLPAAMTVSTLPLALFQEIVPKPAQALPMTSPIIGYGIMAIFAAAIITVSLMPSKRGHQD